MLSTAKPILEMKLRQILIDAYKTQFITNSQAGAQVGIVSSDIDKAALNFANKAAPATADAIYNFVKEIGIMINPTPMVIAPPLPPTLPGGPCTGIIPITNITIF
jgi:hypothetical protein